jgi:small conductance mechanosensitive channel
MTILEQILRDFSNPATLFGALFYALVFLVVAWLAARALRLIVVHLLRRDERGLIDRTAASFITQLIQIGIYLLALILYAHLIPTLRHMGTALLASVGVVSVVLGLAAQNTLGNLVAGIALLLYRPFQVGDLVQVNAPTGLETGTIESLTLGYTVLQTFDNRRIVVPNSVMASQVTINLTAKDPRVMAIVPVSIGYDSDIDRARRALTELAHNHPLVQEIVGCPVTQLGSSGVTLSLRAWCANAGAAKQVEFDLYEQAKKRFDQEGIEIPFPYTNVLLKQVKQSETTS